MKALLRLLFFLLPGLPATAQQPIPERDTSFTIHSAFEKARKTYPFIRVARPPLPKGARQREDIAFCTLGQRHLKLDIIYPAKRRRKPLPAILLIHAGGWRSGDRSHQLPLARALAARGYVTVTAEHRLSTEALYPAALHDVKAAVRWMRAHAREYSIDTGRIAALGCSSGGQLAALVGTTNGRKEFESDSCNRGYSSSVQAIVDIDGILAFIHPESGEGDDSKRPSAATLWFGASKEKAPGLWQQASALNHVDRNTPPALFINSSLPRFHAGRDDMIKKLDSLNIYSEVHTFPDTPHPFWFFHPWFEPTVNHTANFLEKVFEVKGRDRGQ